MKHFFDIGGNNGQTFDYLRTLNNSYKDYLFWIFEPSPRHYEKLLKKCAEMASTYKINICPFGLSSRTEIRHFMEKDDLMGDSFHEKLRSDHEVTNVDNGYKVMASVVSITEFILKHTLPNDQIVLDIDTEGSEYEILNDLISSDVVSNRITEIMVEWHFIEESDMIITPDELTQFCNSKNIRITHRGCAV